MRILWINLCTHGCRDTSLCMLFSSSLIKCIYANCQSLGVLVYDSQNAPRAGFTLLSSLARGERFGCRGLMVKQSVSASWVASAEAFICRNHTVEINIHRDRQHLHFNLFLMLSLSQYCSIGVLVIIPHSYYRCHCYKIKQ